jgi:hypothetical protein
MKIGICIVCIIISTILMFFGLKPITALSTSGMIYIDAPFNEERQYTWEDVDKVYLIIDEETNERSLEFHYKDNEVITLDKKINIESLTVQLMELKKSYGFSFTTKE